MAKDGITSYRLDIESDKWEKFKSLIPKNMRLNDALVTLIERHIEQGKVLGHE